MEVKNDLLCLSIFCFIINLLSGWEWVYLVGKWTQSHFFLGNSFLMKIISSLSQLRKADTITKSWFKRRPICAFPSSLHYTVGGRWGPHDVANINFQCRSLLCCCISMTMAEEHSYILISKSNRWLFWSTENCSGDQR